ncbi:MAG: LysR family transcriptional regulator [Ruminococcus flavefaciens]|nr:LysR family transcriptional regulator [Ruminococcus flavefaciens]
MNVNFEYYKIFYFVAKYGNITKAAIALGSNQPNVTRIIKLLESQLNCRLFIRESRGIRLTEEGETLYSHVEVAYSHLLNAQEEICGQDSQKRGTVTIGATETALHLFLLNLLYDFKLKHPAIRIKIYNQSTPETLKHLISGRFDFAAVTTPFEIPKSLFSVKALDFTEILTGGTQYASLCNSSLKPEDICKYPLIGLGRESATYRFYKELFIAQGVDLEPDMEVAASGLMLPLIEKNLGIGFVPETLAKPLLKEKKLVQISLSCDIPSRSIQIVLDKGRGRSLAADTFYKFLLNAVKDV